MTICGLAYGCCRRIDKRRIMTASTTKFRGMSNKALAIRVELLRKIGADQLDN
jgi:hypothetical protein